MVNSTRSNTVRALQIISPISGRSVGSPRSARPANSDSSQAVGLGSAVHGNGRRSIPGMRLCRVNANASGHNGRYVMFKYHLLTTGMDVMAALNEAKTVTVRPVAGYTGADISGVDISQPLSPEVFGRIRDALHEYKVIFFRDQNLDHASHIAFGRQFGALTYAHPLDEAPPEGYAEIFTVDLRLHKQRYGIDYHKTVLRRSSYFSGWHTDVTAAVNPPPSRSCAPRWCPRSAATPSGPTCRLPTRGYHPRCRRSWTGCAPSTGTAAEAAATPRRASRSMRTGWSRCTRSSACTRLPARRGCSSTQG